MTDPQAIAARLSEAHSGQHVIAELDAWCVRRANGLRSYCDEYVLDGQDLDAPIYRVALGKHAMLMQMRSFLSGLRAILEQSNEG